MMIPAWVKRLMRMGLAGLVGGASLAFAQPADMQPVGRFLIDRTEVTVGAFRRFTQATGSVTAAERAGGGSTYEGGWQQRQGWTWQAPYGRPAADDEPTVHVTHGEAAAYCRWAGKRLPTDAEWGEAAYVERRPDPPAGFVTGRRYPYPTGDSPQGANCLGDCGEVRTVAHAVTSRGSGHARAGSTRAGVNGLYDMGGNAWEWVAAEAGREPRTRGGSWWYGAAQMRDDHVQGKPADTAVVYIGFRCAKDR
ncbi:formylglycine-generating enzyme family protein [Ramlibacter sp.]|uniref:formylglycine-generating enzyme family protein n=1 Tax=Ramlibacter sp. TaxID=1917967 RepID=UPI0035AEF14B